MAVLCPNEIVRMYGEHKHSFAEKKKKRRSER